MSEQGRDGWTEHRLLVLDMLERHEKQIEGSEEKDISHRMDCSYKMGQSNKAVKDLERARAEMTIYMERKFGQFEKLLEEMQKQRSEETAIKLVKITSTWEFRATLLASVTSVAVALIALLS